MQTVNRNSQQREEDLVVSSAWWVSLGTLISRVSGLAKQMLMAHLFGTGMAMDAFRVAFRIPNLLRAVIGEGGLTRVFMPIYADVVEKKGKKSANSFTSSLFIVVSIFLVLTCILLYFIAPIFIPWLADGWQNEPEKIDLAIKILRMMTPFVFFIGLFALLIGFLNSNRKFFIPAVGPAFFNLIWVGGLIGIMIFMRGSDQIAKMFVAVVFMLIASVVQFLAQVPASKKLGAFERPDIKEHKDKIVELGKVLSPAFFSVAINQINMIVDIKLASRLIEGSVSALAFGNILTIFPISLVSKAIGTASLPSLSSYSARESYEEMTNMVVYTLRLMLSIMIPIAIIGFTFSNEIIRFLFERGNFTADVSTPLTTYALMGYIFSIIGYGGANIMIQAFYAIKKVNIAVIGGAISAAVNIALNLLFVGSLGHGGLALASTIGGFTYFVFLLIMYQIQVGGMNISKLIRSCGAYSLIAMGACAVTLLFMSIIGAYLNTGIAFLDKSLHLIIPTAIACGLVIYVYNLFQFEEFLRIAKPLKRRIKKLFSKS